MSKTVVCRWWFSAFSCRSQLLLHQFEVRTQHTGFFGRFERTRGFGNNVSTDASNLERINRWNCAIRMYAERPFLGHGPGTCTHPIKNLPRKPPFPPMAETGGMRIANT